MDGERAKPSRALVSFGKDENSELSSDSFHWPHQLNTTETNRILLCYVLCFSSLLNKTVKTCEIFLVVVPLHFVTSDFYVNILIGCAEYHTDVLNDSLCSGRVAVWMSLVGLRTLALDNGARMQLRRYSSLERNYLGQ